MFSGKENFGFFTLPKSVLSFFGSSSDTSSTSASSSTAQSYEHSPLVEIGFEIPGLEIDNCDERTDIEEKINRFYTDGSRCYDILSLREDRAEYIIHKDAEYDNNIGFKDILINNIPQNLLNIVCGCDQNGYLNKIIQPIYEMLIFHGFNLVKNNSYGGKNSYKIICDLDNSKVVFFETMPITHFQDTNSSDDIHKINGYIKTTQVFFVNADGSCKYDKPPSVKLALPGIMIDKINASESYNKSSFDPIQRAFAYALMPATKRAAIACQELFKPVLGEPVSEPSPSPSSSFGAN